MTFLGGRGIGAWIRSPSKASGSELPAACPPASTPPPLPALAYYIHAAGGGPASAKAAEPLQRLIEIGQDESVLRHPAITDDPLAVDDEQGALRESLVPLPRAVADPVGVGGGAAPIPKEGAVDAA